MGHYVEWRAFIGPVWSKASAAYFWDWSSLAAGATYEPTTAIPATTISGGITSASTSVTLANATGWPSAGSFWIGPNGSGQSWERVTFTGKSTNTLSGLGRETADSEQSGTHGSGAVARFWWPLETNDGALSLTEEMIQAQDGAFVLVDWVAQVAGVTVPQAAISGKNLILIQTRWESGGSMGAWTNALVGWLISPKIQDDERGLKEWSMEIGSVARAALAQSDAPGLQIGPRNLSTNASANASSTLAATYKEAGSGDIAGDPTISASNVTDGTASLWIGERYIGKANVPANPSTSYDGITASRHISQIHVQPYTGQGEGYRWIEITYLVAGSYAGDWVIAGDGYFANLEDYEITAEVGDRVILAENPNLFRAENPDNDARELIDLADYRLWSGADGATQVDAGADATALFEHLDPAGDSLRLYNGPTGQGQSQAVWGTGTRTTPWAPEWANNGGGASATIAAPGPGETMRFIYAPTSPTEAADYWETSEIATPGYTVTASSKAWVLVSLERFDLRLAGDIDSSTTTIQIEDPAGLSLDGLPASGTIQIEQEQISYTSLDRAAGELGGTVSRGASSTTAAAHDEGSRIYFVEGGTATDALPVEEIGLSCSANVIPRDFVIRASSLSTARNPDEANYTNDYSTLATVTGNSATSYTHTPASPARIRHILIEISKMDSQPARPRLAQINAYVDPAVYGETTLDTDRIGAGIEAILEQMGLPAGAINDEGDTVTTSEITTARDNALAVLADIAEITNSRITIGRDSRIDIRADLLWPGGSIPAADRSYDSGEIARIEWLRTGGESISQIEMEWRSADNSEGGIVRYPSTPAEGGQVIRIGPIIASSTANATTAAARRYWIARRSYTMVAEMADEEQSARAGEIHQIAWQFDGEQIATDRAYLCLMSQHEIRGYRWRTSGEWIQVSREDSR